MDTATAMTVNYSDAGNLNLSENTNYSLEIFALDCQAMFGYIQPQRPLQRALYHYVTPTLCILGMCGNLATVSVLSRKRLGLQTNSRSRKESTAHLGLILLAISDLLFCLTLLPRGWVRAHQSGFRSRGFSLYYQAYSNGFVNMFLWSSTWITVALAVFRYLGICHPFRARLLICNNCHLIVYSAIFVISGLFQMPWYWQYHVVEVPCLNGTPVYLLDLGPLWSDNYRVAAMGWRWSRAIFSLAVPGIILTFCNLSLVSALRRSYRLRRRCRVQHEAARAKNRVTLTLVVIAVMFVSLVFPCELLDHLGGLFPRGAAGAEAFLTTRAIANVLQVINFSLNFVVYCAINASFRSALSELFTCQPQTYADGPSLPHTFSFRHISVKASKTMMPGVGYL